MNWKFQVIYPDATTVTIDEPNGWADITWSAKRNLSHHGIFFSIATESFEFIGSAFPILNDLYDEFGGNAHLELAVSYQCEPGVDYEDFFLGKFDFNTYKRQCGDYCYVTISVIASSCVDKFLNRMDQNIDASTAEDFEGNAITPLTQEEVLLPGQVILLQNRAQNDADFSGTFCINTGAGPGSPATGQRVYLPMPFNDTIISEFGDFAINATLGGFIKYLDVPTGQCLDIFDQLPSVDLYEGYQNFLNIYDPTSDTTNCITPSAVVDYEFNGTFQFETHFSGDVEVAITFRRFNKNTGTTSIIQSDVILTVVSMLSGDIVSQPFSVSYSGSPAYLPNDTLMVFFDFALANTDPSGLCRDFDVDIDFTGTNNFNMMLDSLCPDSTTKAYRLYDLLSFSADVYSSGCFEFGIAGPNANFCITNGLFLRNVTQPNEPKLFYNFSDLFKDTQKIFNIGWGFISDESVFAIADIYFFYDPTVVVNVGPVILPGVKWTHAMELTYGTVKVGYTTWEGEEFNGLDEMNTSREYRVLEVDSNNNELDLMSELISAGYTIEITRRKNQANTGTSDWRYDNNLFIINIVEDSSPLTAYKGVDASPSGIYSPSTRFNYILTPVRNLMRWFKSVIAQRPDFATGVLRFNSGTGNYTCQGQMTVQDPIENELMAESEDIDYDEITEPKADPIWLPIYAEFEAPFTMADRAAVLANPYGLIEYICNGVTYSGSIVEIKHNPNEGKATFKLLHRY